VRGWRPGIGGRPGVGYSSSVWRVGGQIGETVKRKGKEGSSHCAKKLSEVGTHHGRNY